MGRNMDVSVGRTWARMDVARAGCGRGQDIMWAWVDVGEGGCMRGQEAGEGGRGRGRHGRGQDVQGGGIYSVHFRELLSTVQNHLPPVPPSSRGEAGGNLTREGGGARSPWSSLDTKGKLK